MKLLKKINHISLIQFAIGLVIFFIVGNILVLEITGKHLISGKNIREFATGSGMTTRTIYASRGNFYSSDEELLASDIVSYKLVAYLNQTRLGIGNVPAYVTDPEAYAKALSPIIGMDEDSLCALLQSEGQYLVEFGSYGNDLTPVQKAQIEALNLTGLEFTAQKKRNYRYGDFASYILGFASNNEDDPDVIEGKMGLEAVMNDILKGRNGTAQYLTDSMGYNLPNGMTSQVDAKNGDDVYLTIDSNVQRDIQLQLSNLKNCSGVSSAWVGVMEASTGKILGIATLPSFDPNKKDITNYNDLYINSPYEVGSVMKPFVYMTAYDNGFDLSQTYMSGSFDLNDGMNPIRDWNKEGWGSITYNEGLIRSSNTAIANILTKGISKETLREKFQQLGFFADMNISGLASYGGVDNMDGSLRDYISSGFGQSSSWTAIEMLQAYSLFANGGSMVKPYVVDYVLDGSTHSVVQKTEVTKSDKLFSDDAISHIQELMYQTVNDQTIGAAHSYKMDDIELYGKTGTAELLENGRYTTSKYSYSFGGLAPYNDPKIVIFASMQCSSADYEAQYNVFPELIKTIVRSALSNLELRNKQTTTVEDSNTYELDNFTNQSVSYATSILQYHNANGIVIGGGDVVTSQSPSAQTMITAGTKVFLLSNGSNITMPNMTGWSRKEVSTYCSMINLNLEYNGTGLVKSQSIPADTVITSDMTLTIDAS